MPWNTILTLEITRTELRDRGTKRFGARLTWWKTDKSLTVEHTCRAKSLCGEALSIITCSRGYGAMDYGDCEAPAIRLGLPHFQARSSWRGKPV